ncbi:MAG: ribonuclease HII [Candidatus Thermoplasmatota archaeon]|nr:ribonuclease HII [Candidatus Thermoplasmatota archaeon]
MICGTDESGRGPCFGPLVVAGILVKNDTELVRIGVADSKKLTPRRREQLAPMIQKIASKYELIVMPAADIDDLRRTMTLNELEVFVYSKIIERLKPDVCYVDAVDVKEERFGRDILAHLSYKPQIISEHKADEKYPIVGAASILAKVTRDEHIRKIASELEPRLNLPLGSGYPSDPVTKKFLQTWVAQFGSLPPHVRKSWETCQQLIRNKNTKHLDDFS